MGVCLEDAAAHSLPEPGLRARGLVQRAASTSSLAQSLDGGVSAVRRVPQKIRQMLPGWGGGGGGCTCRYREVISTRLCACLWVFFVQETDMVYRKEDFSRCHISSMPKFPSMQIG